jgi:hypothetical protein
MDHFLECTVRIPTDINVVVYARNTCTISYIFYADRCMCNKVIYELNTFGIDTDRQGNVYVVGRTSNNILRLSPDGQNSDIIMKEEDGISFPRTLCFSRDFKKLNKHKCNVCRLLGAESIVLY